MAKTIIIKNKLLYYSFLCLDKNYILKSTIYFCIFDLIFDLYLRFVSLIFFNIAEVF